MAQILSWLAEVFGAGKGHPMADVDEIVDGGVRLINGFLDEFTMTVIIVLVGLWVVTRIQKAVNGVLEVMGVTLERVNMILEILMAFRDQTEDEGQ